MRSLVEEILNYNGSRGGCGRLDVGVSASIVEDSLGGVFLKKLHSGFLQRNDGGAPHLFSYCRPGQDLEEGYPWTFTDVSWMSMDIHFA